MKTSPAGRALIERREGRRLSAYRDSVGVLTIGVGHTGRMSPPQVTAGMRITEAQCDAMLATDLAPVEATIARRVTVPMSQNEFDAMASLGFNIGVGGLARSSVIKRLNMGDSAGAAEAFLIWSKPAELIGRREQERAQFLTADRMSAMVSTERIAIVTKTAGTVAKMATRTTIVAHAVAGVTATAAVVDAPPAITAGVGLLAIVSGLYSAWMSRRASLRWAALTKAL